MLFTTKSTTLNLMVKSKLQFQLIGRFQIYFYKIPWCSILVHHLNLIWYEIRFKILIRNWNYLNKCPINESNQFWMRKYWVYILIKVISWARKSIFIKFYCANSYFIRWSFRNFADRNLPILGHQLFLGCFLGGIHQAQIHTIWPLFLHFLVQSI